MTSTGSLGIISGFRKDGNIIGKYLDIKAKVRKDFILKMPTIDEMFKILTEYEDNYKNPDDKDN